MYCPSHFEENRIEVLKTHIRRFPLATLVTINNGELNANHIPMLLCDSDTSLGVLQAHIPRANPLWQSMIDNQALAIFQGANSYISPNWYPTKHEHGKVVPTWNYITVHVRGNLRIIEDKRWLEWHLDRLTNTHEGTQTRPWKLSDAPAEFTDRLIQNLIGLELEITSINGKWKISQNQPSDNQAGVIEALKSQSDPMSAVMQDYLKKQHGE